MQPPRISPRSWFWALTLALFLWAYIGTRSLAGSFLLSAQGVIGWPVDTISVPGKFIATSAQRMITATFRSIGASRSENETRASLEEKNQKLRDQLAIKDGQIALLLEQIRNFNVRKDYGIPPENLREAWIVGRNPGAGAGTITIDKGTADKIAPGMPVIAGENHILGRVSAVGPKTATVRLLTDLNYPVQAMISRHVDGKTVQLLKEPCLVAGLGNGQFGSDVIKTAEATIERGDIVQLMDREWPAKLQYFILGVVTDVRTNPKQMLRYEVRGRANINQIQSVEVLIKY